MLATSETKESSSESLNRLYKLGVNYRQGKCSVDELLATCKKIRERPSSIGQTARQALKEELRRAGILDSTILHQIDNIDTYIITEPKFTERPFSNEDAKFISEGLINNPTEPVYNIITNKVNLPTDDAQNIYDFTNILGPQLNILAKKFGSTYQEFKGVDGIDGQDVKHTFSNPRKDQMDHWFYYTVAPKIDTDLFIREKTTDRIYLKPKIEFWFTVWKDIINQLDSNEKVNKLGYQSKTLNFFQFSRYDFHQMKNQNDRLLFYFGEKGRDEALKIISEYVSAHPEYFENCHSFAAPLIDKDGKSLPGSFTSSADSNGNSFNGIQAEIIKSLINSFCLKFVNESKKTPTKKELIEKISQYPDFKSQFEKFLVSNYNQESKKYGLRKDNIAFVE
jgi:hypothetical protein